MMTYFKAHEIVYGLVWAIWNFSSRWLATHAQFEVGMNNDLHVWLMHLQSVLEEKFAFKLRLQEHEKSASKILMPKWSAGKIIICGFHLWQSVILKLKVLTTTGHGGGYFENFWWGCSIFWISMTTCFRKFGRKRHPALEFLANNNTMWCYFFQNFSP